MRFKIEKNKEDDITKKIVADLLDEINLLIGNKLISFKDDMISKEKINMLSNVIVSLGYSFLANCILKICKIHVDDKESLNEFIQINKSLFEETLNDLKKKFIQTKIESIEDMKLSIENIEKFN